MKQQLVKRRWENSPEKNPELDFLLHPCHESEVFSLGFCSLNLWIFWGAFNFRTGGKKLVWVEMQTMS